MPNSINQQVLQDFLDERPAISKRPFARHAKISPRTLDYILAGREITDETREKLEPVMRKYGWREETHP